MLSSSATRLSVAGRTQIINGSRTVARRTIVSRSSRLSRRLRPASSSITSRNLLPVAEYTTERIVEKKSGKKNLPTVYDASQEKENCGVGLVASLKSIPTRQIVDDADEMLIRMSHRGGCGCDPASGDGAGGLSSLINIFSCFATFQF